MTRKCLLSFSVKINVIHNDEGNLDNPFQAYLLLRAWPALFKPEAKELTSTLDYCADTLHFTNLSHSTFYTFSFNKS